MGYTIFNWVFNRFYLFLVDSSGFYSVWLGFIGFLVSLAGFYWVSMGFY